MKKLTRSIVAVIAACMMMSGTSNAIIHAEDAETPQPEETAEAMETETEETETSEEDIPAAEENADVPVETEENTEDNVTEPDAAEAQPSSDPSESDQEETEESTEAEEANAEESEAETEDEAAEVSEEETDTEESPEEAESIAFEVMSAEDDQTTEDTFTSYHDVNGNERHGEYTLGYILNHYNVFASGDYTGTHVVGPVIAGGNVKVSLGGLSSEPMDGAPHTVPSYIGGTAELNGNQVSMYNDDLFFYTSSVNRDKVGVVGKTNQNLTDQTRVRYTDNFINQSECSQILIPQ